MFSFSISSSPQNSTILRTVKESWYSCERDHHFEQLSRIIPHEKVVYDLNAHIGGFSLRWACKNKESKIYSIELDETVSDVLKSNVAELKLDNVNVITGDSAKVVWDIPDTPDIIYMDPPWGGKDYKNEATIDLFYGEVNAVELIQQMLEKWKNVKVYFKVPLNYNFESLNNVINNYKVWNIYGLPKGKWRKRKIDYLLIGINI